MDRRLPRVSSPRRRGVKVASPVFLCEEMKKEEMQDMKKSAWLRSRSQAFAAAAEAYIVPVRSDPAAATVAAAAGVGCTCLLLQTPQALDDAVDALALQHHLSPDDSGFVQPPLKFSYESAGRLHSLSLPADTSRAAAAEDATAAAAEDATAAPAAGGREGAAATCFEKTCCSQGHSNTPAYDWLYALGCLNCGKPLTLAADLLPSAEAATSRPPHPTQAVETDVAGKRSSSSSSTGERTRGDQERRPPALTCSSCGHHVCPLHEANEAETLVDAKRLPDFCCSSSSSNWERHSLRSTREASTDDSAREFGRSDGVYLFGLRQQYVTGEWSKRLWQERFLGSNFQQQQLQQQLRLVEAVGKEKHGVVCKETCEKCGNNEAFYSSFQARSADEGMTVMYECTRCGHRRVLNT